jgi:hypothetical protein
MARSSWIALLAAFALALPVEARSKSSQTVVCKDGTISKGGKGACSHHGGIDKSGTAAAPNPEATPPGDDVRRSAAQGREAAQRKADRAKGKATARCKDGTLSYSKNRSGTCSQHGGVAEWLNAQ